MPSYKALATEKDSPSLGPTSRTSPHSIVSIAASPSWRSSPTASAYASTSAPGSRWRPSIPLCALVLMNVLFLGYWHRELGTATTSATDSGSSWWSSSGPLRASESSATTYAFSNTSRFKTAQEAFLSASRPMSAPASCEVCLYAPDAEQCQYGLDNVRLSRAYSGSGARVRKFLEKAMRGEEVHVGVIGASVTQGHSVQILLGERRWQDRFWDDFQEMFPNAKLHQEAIVPAMNSGFFSYCAGALLPGPMDLYLVELDINNGPFDLTLMEDDALYRGLLDQPHEPAVVRLAVFTLAFRELARGSISSQSISAWFDIPIISLRHNLLDHVVKDRAAAEDYMGINVGQRDYRHIGVNAHQMLGDMLSLYLQEQMCEVRRRQADPPRAITAGSSIWPPDEEHGQIPPLYIWSSWATNIKPVPITPTCHSVFSPLDPLKPTAQTGQWTFEEWNDKKAWSSHTPGSTVTFDFRGTRLGIFVWMTAGRGEVHGPGQANCSVDGGKPVLVDTFSDREAAGPSFELIADGLESGKHTVTCEVLHTTSSTGHKWRIQGVASQ